MSDFVSGAILVLVGAALGFAAGRIEAWRDRRARKRAVATAILVELRPLERVLRRLVAHREAALSTLRPMTEVHDRFGAYFVLFSTRTVRDLLHLRGLLRDIEITRDNVRAGSDEANAHTHHFVRAKASFAASLVPTLRKHLESEGGEAPADDPPQTFPYPALPPLPPPAFPGAVP